MFFKDAQVAGTGLISMCLTKGRRDPQTPSSCQSTTDQELFIRPASRRHPRTRPKKLTQIPRHPRLIRRRIIPENTTSRINQAGTRQLDQTAPQVPTPKILQRQRRFGTSSGTPHPSSAVADCIVIFQIGRGLHLSISSAHLFHAAS